MREFLSKLKSRIIGDEESPHDEEDTSAYVELDTTGGEAGDERINVRSFTITDFQDVKQILDLLREGNTIALVNIKPLKDKDLLELKRSINKLKKTCDAIEGDIAGFGDDWIVATPVKARIYRNKETQVIEEQDEKGN